jgi:hypothetical protein
MRDQKVAAMLAAVMAQTDKEQQLRDLVDLVVRLLKHGAILSSLRLALLKL